MESPQPFDPRELQKRDAVLLEGLRAALAGEEHRLYTSGKSEGLFAGRTGLHGEAAELALREELLEHARSEAKGRFEVEFVRLMPKGVEYLYQHDSPRAILGQMRTMLTVAQSGIPMWQDEMLKSLERLAGHITEQMARHLDQLDALTKRVDEALRRSEVPTVMNASLQAVIPWGADALAYLDRRKAGETGGACPLPELFAAVHPKHNDLTLREFHEGLQRLAEHRAISLAPWAGPGSIPRPEYAMMAEGKLMYLVLRT